MFLNSMRHGVFSGIFLGVLLLGAFGLMLSDWGGFFKNGVHRTDVASIDGHAIHAQEFDHLVRRQLQGQKLSLTDAYRAGMIDRILQNEITQRLLRKASYDYGIVASDAVVADRIKKILELIAGKDGDMKQALNRVLQMQGMREPELVESLRNDLSTGLLRDTIGNGIYVPASMTKRFYDWNMEERAIRYITLPESAIEISAPSDDELVKFYDTVKTAYAVPESRDVTIGILDPSKLVEKKEITDEQVKKYYEAHKNDFAVPETRTLEQAVLKSEDEAKNVLKMAKELKGLKAAVLKVTGKNTAYNISENLEEKALPDEISKPVFAAKASDYVGPVQSPLGWHVIFVKSIAGAGVKPFEKVKTDIKQTIANSSDGDAVYDLTNKIEDRLAGGENPSEMAQEFQMKVISLKGVHAGSTQDEFKQFGPDQSRAIEAAFATAENESSPLSEIKDGRMFTIHVDHIAPSHAKDLKDVKEHVLKQWMDANKRKKLLVKAMEMTQNLDDKKTTLEEIAKTAKTDIKTAKVVRGSAPPAGISKEGVAQIMSTAVTKTIAIPVDKDITIAIVDKVTLPSKMPSASELANIEKNLSLDLQEERFVSFVNAVERSGKANINHDLLEQMYGQEQTE